MIGLIIDHIYANLLETISFNIHTDNILMQVNLIMGESMLWKVGWTNVVIEHETHRNLYWKHMLWQYD